MNDTPPRMGHVTLVGAGPGDADLLTIKAVRAIRRATLLLVDDLVSDEVLRYARPSARIVHVGKRGGCASTPQAFIQKLMGTEALKGERVVRLKGGDPFVFGRGGEEAEHLRALGIAVEVVNGITSGLAAATALGVPLTHRKHAHGVVFVTGHPRGDPSDPGDHQRTNQSGRDAGLHWPTLAAAAAQGLTLIIYMGVATAASVQSGLLQALGPLTPVAVIQHATLPQQRHVVCPLQSLADTITQERLGSPAIIIVGDVLQGLRSMSLPTSTERAA